MSSAISLTEGFWYVQLLRQGTQLFNECSMCAAIPYPLPGILPCQQGQAVPSWGCGTVGPGSLHRAASRDRDRAHSSPKG